jgi:hypothetical protein
MEHTEIFEIIQIKMDNIKRTGSLPKVIVVSSKVLYEIKNSYYSIDRNNSPYFPDFSQMQDIRYDKLFGLPLALIETNKLDYIEVF